MIALSIFLYGAVEEIDQIKPTICSYLYINPNHRCEDILFRTSINWFGPIVPINWNNLARIRSL